MVEPRRPDPDRPDPDPDAPLRRGFWQRVFGGGEPIDPATGLQWSGLAAAAEQRGWPLQDDDPALAPVLAQAPLRLTPEHRAAPVLRGRHQTWELVAFDVRYLMPRGELSSALYAVTAMPVLVELPTIRIAPRRFLTHGAAGLFVVPTEDPDFDGRWRVLAGREAPEVRALLGPDLRAALLDGPDIDELWTAAGHLAVSRADGHHEALLTTHADLLAAAMTGLRPTPD